MTQHKCGTCLHFEEGGIAGTGWCRHPLRMDIQNVVLVRRNELACRDGWSGDLWESRNVAPIAPVDGAAVVVSRNGSEAQPSINQHTDKVTTVAISQPRPGNRPTATPPRLEQAAVMRHDTPNGRENHRPEPLPLRRLPESDFAAARIQRGEGYFGSANRLSPTPLRSSPLRAEESENRPAVMRTGSEPDRPPAPAPAGAGVAESRPAPQFGARSEGWSAPAFPPPGGRRGETQPLPPAQPRQHDALERVVREPDLRRPPVPGEPALPEANAQVEAPATVERAIAVPAKRTPGPVSAHIAELARCCRTCRDFRPVDGGERGWCNNPYAFSDRKQVSRDDIACQSSIGDWWTAGDDWWLQQADISQHGRPTPHVNELLKELLLRRRDGRS